MTPRDKTEKLAKKINKKLDAILTQRVLDARLEALRREQERKRVWKGLSPTLKRKLSRRIMEKKGGKP